VIVVYILEKMMEKEKLYLLIIMKNYVLNVKFIKILMNTIVMVKEGKEVNVLYVELKQTKKHILEEKKN
jgi:hypothetical protein